MTTSAPSTNMLVGRSRIRPLPLFIILLIFMIAVVTLAPLVGSTSISLYRAVGFGVAEGEFNSDSRILFQTRLPRVIFALLAGSALALSGAVYQAVLRNDLADPYTLGVSGGSAFGALLAMMLFGPGVSRFMLPAVTFASALLAVWMIHTLARLRGPSTSPVKLLLAGVTLNMIFGAAILLVQYLSDPFRTLAMIRWMMGGTDIGSWSIVAFVGLVLLLAGGWLITKARVINLLSVGELSAAHLGISVDGSRRSLMIAASLLAAAVVAYAGPVGFVGLVIPHIIRLLAGPDHRILLPACLLAGGPFLVLCDTAGRTLLAPTELPVGIITALIGAPFFLWLLFRRG